MYCFVLHYRNFFLQSTKRRKERTTHNVERTWKEFFLIVVRLAYVYRAWSRRLAGFE